MHNRVAFISTLILSLCIGSLVPASVHWLLHWREPFLEMPGYKTMNFYTPLGFYSLGLEAIGFIVLWTGFRKRQRASWFIMLILSLFLIFPLNVLNLALMPGLGVSDVFNGLRLGNWVDIWIALGAATFAASIFALLLPVRAFFVSSTTTK